jgi:hypothetical protein
VCCVFIKKVSPRRVPYKNEAGLALLYVKKKRDCVTVPKLQHNFAQRFRTYEELSDELPCFSVNTQ